MRALSSYPSASRLWGLHALSYFLGVRTKIGNCPQGGGGHTHCPPPGVTPEWKKSLLFPKKEECVISLSEMSKLPYFVKIKSFMNNIQRISLHQNEVYVGLTSLQVTTTIAKVIHK